MKIFFAGAFGYKFHEKLKLDVLESYYYLSNTHKQMIQQHIAKCADFFLDSGAFSAFTQNVDIDIDKYIDFCKSSGIKNYAVLDAIGSAEKTLKNQQYMESKGVSPIPCFHYGEDFKYLDFYCTNYDYVALGGMVPITTSKLKLWLDVIFSRYPKQKFHGFGLTVLSLMNRYPWYSVDSTSYLQGTKTASIYINDKTICINGDSNDDFHKITFEERKEFDYMCNKYGFTLEKLRRDTDDKYEQKEKGYWLRCLYNIYYFLEFLDKRNIEFKEFKPVQKQLFETINETSNLTHEVISDKNRILEKLRIEFPDIPDTSLELIMKQRGEEC